MSPSRDLRWLLFFLSVAATAAFLRFPTKAPQPISLSTSSLSQAILASPSPTTADASSLSIHGVQLGMSRNQVESLLGSPSLDIGDSVEYYHPASVRKKKAPYDDPTSIKYERNFVVEVHGDQLERAGKRYSGLRLKEAEALFGPPTFYDKVADMPDSIRCRYERVKLTVGFDRVEDEHKRKHWLSYFSLEPVSLIPPPNRNNGSQSVWGSPP